MRPQTRRDDRPWSEEYLPIAAVVGTILLVVLVTAVAAVLLVASALVDTSSLKVTQSHIEASVHYALLG